MFSSNCGLLTCIQVSQEAGKMFWYSHLLKNFLLFAVIYTVKLEKEMATHSSILAWKIPWMEEPGVLQSMGSQRVGHNWATSLTHTVKSFSLVNEAEVEVFLDFSSFFYDPVDVGHLISAKEYSNYCTIALISHDSKIILNSLKLGFSSLEVLLNWELPDVQARFRKGQRNHREEDQIPKEEIKRQMKMSGRRKDVKQLVDLKVGRKGHSQVI